jgi:hypothetical protein
MSVTILTPLVEFLQQHVPAPAVQWLEGAVGSPTAFDRGQFLEAMAAAGRRVGKSVLAVDQDQARGLPGLDWLARNRPADELARVALLLRAGEALDASSYHALVEDCYSRGDLREKQAVLRALPLVPEPERFVPLAVEACRTHIQPVFEAIACENPYPATYFPELNFNQMVLKALFIGVALDRVLDLEARVTPELGRMAEDYASERRAAGRSVPSDIARLVERRQP